MTFEQYYRRLLAEKQAIRSHRYSGESALSGIRRARKNLDKLAAELAPMLPPTPAEERARKAEYDKHQMGITDVVIPKWQG